jgi:hypothetical protein
MRMAHETGVAMNWLLDGNPKVPPYARNQTPFTRATFDRARSKAITPFSGVIIPFAVREFSEAIASILHAAYASGDAELATYKIGRAITELASEFGGEKAKRWEFVTQALRRHFFAHHEQREEALTAKKQRRKKRSSRGPKSKA